MASDVMLEHPGQLILGDFNAHAEATADKTARDLVASNATMQLIFSEQSGKHTTVFGLPCTWSVVLMLGVPTMNSGGLE